MSVQLLSDHFRFPEELIDGLVEDVTSSHLGFFRIGSNVCYGRSSAKTVKPEPRAAEIDVMSGYGGGNGTFKLPFNPDEVIDNLRLERYPHQQVSGVEKLLKKLYYQIRPWTTPYIRREIQRLHAHNWRKLSFPTWPVDTTVENVFQILLREFLINKGLDRVPFIWFWPKGLSGCVLMTHDVETSAGRDFCSQLMDIDDESGIKASFQIVPEDRYGVPVQLLEEIRHRNFEIAVQDLNHDGRLFDSKEAFLSRVAAINRYGRELNADGFRAAVLYRRPDWLEFLEFSYDMSFPNVAHLDPQRGGCCTVFPYFIGNVLEIPVTTVQDYTLFHLLGQRSINLWQEQAEQILSKNGLVSFIVHPDYIVDSETQSVYLELLNYLNQLRAQEYLWFCLPCEVNDWWRARSQMSVVKDGKNWRIVGEGANHAVLAFAEVSDGNLVYTLRGNMVS